MIFAGLAGEVLVIILLKDERIMKAYEYQSGGSTVPPSLY